MTCRTTEAVVLRACLDLLLLRRWFFWRNNSGLLRNHTGQPVRFGYAGSSDIIGIVPRSGRLLAVECKRPGGKTTEAQTGFLAAVQRAGGVAVVISDVADLARLLDRLEVDPWYGTLPW